MSLSRIARSVARSSCSAPIRDCIFNKYGVRRVFLDDLSSHLRNATASRVDHGLGLVTGFMTSSVSSTKGDYVLANPNLRRLFSTGGPKKRDYENYYPKEKKELPKQNNQKARAKAILIILSSLGKWGWLSCRIVSLHHIFVN